MRSRFLDTGGLNTMIRLLSIFSVLILFTFAGPAADAETKPKPKHGEEAGFVFQRFVAMEVVSAPIINRNRIRGRAEVELVLEVLGEEKAKDVNAQMPRIHAAFITVTQRYVGSIKPLTQPLDLDLLLRSLQATANQILAPGIVVVLVQQATYRR
jgi:hypothetical protein